jgi:hypothetical protein
MLDVGNDFAYCCVAFCYPLLRLDSMGITSTSQKSGKKMTPLIFATVATYFASNFLKPSFLAMVNAWCDHFRFRGLKDCTFCFFGLYLPIWVVMWVALRWMYDFLMLQIQ